MASKTFPVTGSLYTEKFNEFLLSKTSDDSESDTYEETIKPLFTEKFGENSKFWDIFINKWLFHEITAETETLQCEYIASIFHMWSDYYKIKYSEYTKEFDYSTATLISRNRTQTDNDTGTIINDTKVDLSRNVTNNDNGSVTTTGKTTTTETPDLTETNIDLPRKDTATEYPSSKVKSTGTDKSEDVVDNKVVNSDTATTGTTGIDVSHAQDTKSNVKQVAENETYTDNEKYLDAKEKYMNQLKNIELEFADKFTDCFIHIYS